ncbi:MAG: N-acetylmuramoyl-L-alanine amidase CwlD [Alkaliphilus sp.]
MLRIIIIRKKRMLIIITLAIFLCIIAMSLIKIRSRYIETIIIPANAKIIIIDPGHGGIDPGAVGKTGIVEKDINLAISLFLKDYLEKSGEIVVLTRSSDIGLHTSEGSLRSKKEEDLKNRKEIVRSSKGDLFLSIHLNSFTHSKYYGAQTFYASDNVGGEKLAKRIQLQLRNVLDENNKRESLVKDNMYLIRKLDIPAVLIECGFLSNPREEKLLNDVNYQKKIAWAIYTALQKYFAEYEGY